MWFPGAVGASLLCTEPSPTKQMDTGVGLEPKRRIPTEVSVMEETAALRFIHSGLLGHTKFFVLDGRWKAVFQSCAVRLAV